MKKNFLKFHFKAFISTFLLMTFFATLGFSQSPDETDNSLAQEYDPENYLPNWILQLELGNELALSETDKIYIDENLTAIRNRKITFVRERKKAVALQEDEMVVHYQTQWQIIHLVAQKYFKVITTILEEH